MTDAKTCPKCTGSMAEGFVVDKDYGAAGVSSWVEGTPNKSFWVGVKLDGHKTLEIKTWRCGRCGLLENYAPPA